MKKFVYVHGHGRRYRSGNIGPVHPYMRKPPPKRIIRINTDSAMLRPLSVPIPNQRYSAGANLKLGLSFEYDRISVGCWMGMTGPNVACSLKVDEDVTIGVVYNCISGASVPYLDYKGKSISLGLASDWIISQMGEGF